MEMDDHLKKIIDRKVEMEDKAIVTEEPQD